MPSATDLVINDGQATPVAHTFEPAFVQTAKSIFFDRTGSGSTSAGYTRLELGYSMATPKRTTNRVRISLAMPIEKTVDGRAEIACIPRANIDIILPDELTQAERDDMAAYVKNTLANAVVNGYISDLDPVYG